MVAMDELAEALPGVGPLILTAVVLAAAWWFVLWRHRRRQGLSSRAAAAQSARDVGLGLWIVLVPIVTLTPTPHAYAARIVRLVPSDLEQLILLRRLSWDLIGQTAANCMLFLPFGFLAPARWTRLRNPLVLVAVAAMLSSAVELLQYAFAIGRTTSTDDVWANSLGALTGWVIYRGTWGRRSKAGSRIQVPAARG